MKKIILKSSIGFNVLLIVFLMTNCKIAGQCNEPPRNVKYSSNFYNAQTFFMEKSNAKSTDLSVVVNGVPIGGSNSSQNWSKQISQLTEEDAINFIKTELSNYKSQIFAEAGFVLCQISQIPNPTPIQLRAIEAIERIASIALGIETNNSNKNGDFELLPSNPYIFFKEGESKNKTLVLKVANTTSGKLDLEIEQENFPDDFPWYVKYALKDLNFTLNPNESKLLPFYINYPKEQINPYQATIKIKSKTNHSIYAITTVNIIPSDDYFQIMPEILNGEIKTNASIKCTANDNHEFTAEHTDWFSLPYNAGPSMRYAGQTSCQAITNASTKVDASDKKNYSWSVDITNICGGMCGGNGHGGHGVVKPEYRTTIKLPYISKTSSWTLVLRGKGTDGDGISNVYFTGNGSDKSFSFDRSGTPQRLIIDKLKGGDYKLEIVLPKLERGCYGSAPGTDAKTSFNSNLSVEITRVD